MPSMTMAMDGTALVANDPYLQPFTDALRHRHGYYRSELEKINRQGGLLGPITQGHRYFGFNRGELWGKSGVWYREWARMLPRRIRTAM